MLREFLYVDVTRTRSLLGQMDRGVVESVVEKSSQGTTKDPTSILGFIGGGGLWTRTDASEVAQTRSLEDTLFVVLEEAIEAAGILVDVEADQIPEWEDSTIHGQLQEGQLIRVNADVMFLDPSFVKSRLDGLMAVFDSVKAIQEQNIDAQMKTAKEQGDRQIGQDAEAVAKDKRSHTKRKAKKELETSLETKKADALAKLDSTAEMEPILALMNDFLTSEAITLRVLPCGQEQTSYSFVGSLLGRDDYIQPEREALFSRYGSVVSGWTCVLQIAAIPEQKPPIEGIEFTELSRELVEGGIIDRGRMERLALKLLEKLESMGLSEGPKWPTVSVVPLGIYRTIPGSMSERPE